MQYEYKDGVPTCSTMIHVTITTAFISAIHQLHIFMECPASPDDSTVEFLAHLALGDPPVHVTIVSSTAYPDIDSISSDDLRNRKTVIVGESTRDAISALGNGPFDAIVSTSDRRVLWPAVFYPFGPVPDAFQLIQLNHQKRLLSIPLPPPTRLSDPPLDTIAHWSVENPPAVAGDSEQLGPTGPNGPSSFSMALAVSPIKSSSTLSPKKAHVINLLPQSHTDPCRFLLSRYYSTLYSLTMPLAYFPKTSLARLSHMCNGDTNRLSQCLDHVYVLPEKLEQRHAAKYGMTLFASENPNYVIDPLEAENQLIFLSKHVPEATHEDQRNDLLLKLKIREAQMQVLVVLELLSALKIDDEEFLRKNHAEESEQSQKASRVRKPSLVRSRRLKKTGKKTIIPTFLGMGVHDDIGETPATHSQSGKSNRMLYTSLVALVDHMSIWDTLLGGAPRDKDHSPVRFLGLVVIPFYRKRLPAIVAFITEKIRDLRPKFRLKLKLKSKLKISESSPSVLSVAESPNHSLDPAHTKVPVLRRSKSLVNSPPQAAFSLKRSKSSLGSKNLKRRQVDMSVEKATKGEDPEKLVQQLLQLLLVFGDARRSRTKSVPPLAQPPPEISQVEATPAKNRTRIFPEFSEKSQVEATPAKNSSVFPNVQQISQVEATPAKTKDSVPSVLQTPSHTQKTVVPESVPRRSTVAEKLSMLAPEKPGKTSFSSFSAITSSPVSTGNSPIAPRQDSISSPFLHQPQTRDSVSSPFVSNVKSPEKSAPTFLIRQESTTTTNENDYKTDADDSEEMSEEKSGDDSDSDFEKLLASTSNRTLKTYTRKK